jgi:hypothetical protein
LLLLAFLSGCDACAPSCPAGGCPTDQRCRGSTDFGSFCCGAPGVSEFELPTQIDCCEPSQHPDVCGCEPLLDHLNCAADSDCCNGHCDNQRDGGLEECVCNGAGAACSSDADCCNGACLPDGGAPRCG